MCLEFPYTAHMHKESHPALFLSSEVLRRRSIVAVLPDLQIFCSEWCLHVCVVNVLRRGCQAVGD